ncbi:vertebrate ancient long opsin a isoform X2 [Hemitrygon akajei]|uniref:vertebrate ancient long opsin a isoform X2 n=1 Tax=Hemitrygon akajei TaxID=2704970 RepID=UPI003BF98D6F
MFFVTFLSLSENFTVLLVTYKYKQLRQPLNYIILNLSLADFLVSTIGGTLSFVTNLYGYFVLGEWACVLEGFSVTFFGIVALWSLAVLAFERYFVICRPLGNVRLQGKHAALGIVFIWVFSFIWTIPPTFGWSSYTVSPIGTTCEPNWYSGEFNDHTYIIALFTSCFIMPLLVIFVSYGKLLRKLRKFRQCVLQMFSLSESDANPTADHAMQGGNHNRSEMSTVARMKTSYVNATKHEECSKRDTFAQQPIPENEVCPV